MDTEQSVVRDQDIGRGTALIVTGTVMVILKFVVPWVMPLAVGAYGVYRLYKKQLGEGLIFLALAVVAWYLGKLVEWSLVFIGALFVGFGLFYLLKGFRADAVNDEPEA